MIAQLGSFSSGALKRAVLAVSILAGVAAFSAPAFADGRHHGRHGHGHGHWSHGHGHWGHGGGHWRGGHRHLHSGWRSSFSFYTPLYLNSYPRYYPSYYPGEPVVLSRSPAYAWPDNTYRRQAYAQAFDAPLGQSFAWNDSGGSGSITTTRDGKSGDRYCREFQQEVVIDGKRQKAFGAACQSPDGSWEIVPDAP